MSGEGKSDVATIEIPDNLEECFFNLHIEEEGELFGILKGKFKSDEFQQSSNYEERPMTPLSIGQISTIQIDQEKLKEEINDYEKWLEESIRGDNEELLAIKSSLHKESTIEVLNKDMISGILEKIRSNIYDYKSLELNNLKNQLCIKLDDIVEKFQNSVESILKNDYETVVKIVKFITGVVDYYEEKIQLESMTSSESLKKFLAFSKDFTELTKNHNFKPQENKFSKIIVELKQRIDSNIDELVELLKNLHEEQERNAKVICDAFKERKDTNDLEKYYNVLEKAEKSLKALIAHNKDKFKSEATKKYDHIIKCRNLEAKLDEINKEFIISKGSELRNKYDTIVQKLDESIQEKSVYTKYKNYKSTQKVLKISKLKEDFETRFKKDSALKSLPAELKQIKQDEQTRIQKEQSNEKDKTLEEMVLDIKNAFKMKLYQYNYRDQPFNSKNPCTIRVMLDLELLGFYHKSLIKTGELHYIEKIAFNQAKKILDGVTSFKEYIKHEDERNHYPRNVVLVDFFVIPDRDNENATIGDKEKLDIHTVALWKVDDNQIVVVEPNAHTSSRFLFKALQNLYGMDIMIYLSEEFYDKNFQEETFYTNGQSKSVIIYEECGIKEEDLSLYQRNCIDISTKNAFELNEIQHKWKQRGMIVYDVKEVLLQLAKNLSNNHPSIPDYFKGFLHKKFHSSIKEERNMSRDYLESLFSQPFVKFLHKAKKNDKNQTSIYCFKD